MASSTTATFWWTWRFCSGWRWRLWIPPLPLGDGADVYNSRNVRALVTGGAGFIGSHLCRRLLTDGWSVTCVDNFASGMRRNVAGLLEHPGFQLIEQDVSAAPLSDDLRADRYFHMASPASPNPHTPRS